MRDQLVEHKPDMLRLVRRNISAQSRSRRGLVKRLAGPWASSFFLLLLSAANTAMVAMIGVFYMMARDGEMPAPIHPAKNRHGVPIVPLAIAIGLPVVVLVLASDFEILAGLYAIGRGRRDRRESRLLHAEQSPRSRGVGARALFAFTFLILLGVELTLAHEENTRHFFFRRYHPHRRPHPARLLAEALRPHYRNGGAGK